MVLEGQTLTLFRSDFDILGSPPHGAAAAGGGRCERSGLSDLLGPAGSQRNPAPALSLPGGLARSQGRAAAPDGRTTPLGVEPEPAGAAADMDVAHLECGLAARARGRDRGRPGDTAPGRRFAGGHDPSGSRGGRRSPLSGSLGTLQRWPVRQAPGRGRLGGHQGRLPLATEAFSGNTPDPAAFGQAIEAARCRFALRSVIFSGDGGMITLARIAALRQLPGRGRLGALRAPRIGAPVEGSSIQPSLFDQANLAEIDSPPSRLLRRTAGGPPQPGPRHRAGPPDVKRCWMPPRPTSTRCGRRWRRDG